MFGWFWFLFCFSKIRRNSSQSFGPRQMITYGNANVHYIDTVYLRCSCSVPLLLLQSEIYNVYSDVMQQNSAGDHTRSAGRETATQCTIWVLSGLTVQMDRLTTELAQS